MAFPLDLFVTPYQGPGQQPSSASGFNALGDFGTQLREEAHRKALLEQQKYQYDRSQANTEFATKSLDAYHQDTIAARREASRNALQGKRDAQVMKIRDAIRVAQRNNRPEEVQSLLAELARLGFSVSEEDTLYEAPEAKVAELTPDVPAPKVSTATLPKTPAGEDLWLKQPKPEFGFMGGALADKGEAPQLKAPQVSPLPWERGTVSAPAEPPKKKKGGRFTIRDRGNLVDTIDSPMEMEKDRGAIEDALSIYIEDPQNPEQQAAARRASVLAQKAIQTGMSPDKALQMGREQLNKEMQRYKTQKLPSAQPPPGTGGGGLSKEDRLRLGAVGGDVEKVVDQIQAAIKLPALNEARRHTQRGLAMLQGDRSGFRDVNAMAQLLKEMSGATVSDAEYGRYVGGGSEITRLETKIRSYTAGGKLPDDLIAELREVFERASNVQRTAIDNAGALAYDQVKGRLLTAKPEEAERLANTARDYFKNQFGKPAGDASPKADGRKRSMEWLDKQPPVK